MPMRNFRFQQLLVDEVRYDETGEKWIKPFLFSTSNNVLILTAKENKESKYITPYFPFISSK